jgi:hypothetical protein
MQTSETNHEKQVREPYCWQEKRILRTIRDVFEKRTGLKSSAIALYTALTEIASDYQSDTFTVNQTTIGNRAGLTDRTLRKILPIFQTLGVVTVKRNYVDGLERQTTYCLHRAAESVGKFFRTPGKRFKNEFPTLEESPEKSHEHDDNGCATNNAQQSSSIPSWEEAQKHPLWIPLAKQFKRYCERTGGSPTPQGWRTWASKQPTPKPKATQQPNNGATQVSEAKMSDAERAARVERFKMENRKVLPQMK